LFFAKLYIYTFSFLFGISLQAQIVLQSPVDSPLYLSGNFCALRDNHFHFGLDIPTNNEQGWRVKAAADGYVSRIHVSPYGYGKSIFITHAGGYTTVYAHLSAYKENIDMYLKAQQYKRESYAVDLFPKAGLLKVRQGEVIAWSGNSGGSSGPHLHFELRNAYNQLLDPAMFGLAIPDTFAPSIDEVVFETRGSKNERWRAHATMNNETLSVVAGWVYPHALIYDRATFEVNKLAPKYIETTFDGKVVFSCRFDKYAFGLDYNVYRFYKKMEYAKQMLKYTRLYISDGVNLPFYEKSISGGRFYVNDLAVHKYSIKLVDHLGKETIKNFFVSAGEGLKNENDQTTFESISAGKYFMAYPSKAIDEKIEENFILTMPAYSLFDSEMVKVDYMKMSNSVNLVSSNPDCEYPFIKAGKLTMKVYKTDFAVADSTKLTLAYKSKEGVSAYAGGKYHNGYISSLINGWGTYHIFYDDEAPEIILDSTTKYACYFHVHDNFSGVAAYRASINGKFALAEYDGKSGSIIYKIDEHTLAGTIQFSLSAIDKKGNEAQWQKTIALKPKL
jgi:hypothetical protein